MPSKSLKILFFTLVVFALVACSDQVMPEVAAVPTLIRETAVVSTATPPTLPAPFKDEPGAGTPGSTAILPSAPPPVAGPGSELIVHFLDVGQGDATLLAGPDFTILIDAGRHDRSDVVPYLRAVGVQAIDLLVGTHPHADHIGQFPAVLRQFPVTEVWMSGDSHTTRTFERAIDAILTSGASYHEPRAGEIYQIGSARVEILNPDRLTGHLHEGSISLRIVFGGIAFVFTGDADAQTEAAMIARNYPVRAQILQLGHHGSSTSSTLPFLQAVNPEVAVYSAGRNNQYGHPHAEVIGRLRRLGIGIYGTDVNGTIRVVTDGVTYRLEFAHGQSLQPPAVARAQPMAAPLVERPEPAVQGGHRLEQLNISSAGRDELVQVIQIGPQSSGQMVQLRPFHSIGHLTRINGIGPARLGDIKAEAVACCVE
jgi:competence protein ComEC